MRKPPAWHFSYVAGRSLEGKPCPGCSFQTWERKKKASSTHASRCCNCKYELIRNEDTNAIYSTVADLLPISAMVSGILVQCTLAMSVGLEPGRCAVAPLIDIS